MDFLCDLLQPLPVTHSHGDVAGTLFTEALGNHCCGAHTTLEGLGAANSLWSMYNNIGKLQ